jgi:hypothetical protein
MRKNLKSIVSVLMCFAMLLVVASCVKGNPTEDKTNYKDVSEYLIAKNEVPYILHYDEETPFINDNVSQAFGSTGKNVSWENWSLPIGNGYFGVNVFGRTETERVQIADKTLENAWQANIPEEGWPQTGGLNNFAETYLDIVTHILRCPIITDIWICQRLFRV